MGESVKNSRLLVFLLCLLFLCLPLTHASSILRVTVGTDKPSYFQGETATVSGKVTLEENPLIEKLVALEVKDGNGDTVAVVTNQTSEEGWFDFAFKLSPNADYGDYMVYVSVGWENQIAVNCTTFEIKAPAQTGDHETSGGQQTLSSLEIPILLILLGILLPSTLIIPIFAFLQLKGVKVKVEAPAPPERKIDEKHKICTNCGKKFLRIHTFCPYCLTYHGQNNL